MEDHKREATVKNIGCVTDATLMIYRLVKSLGVELNSDELGEIIRILRDNFDNAYQQGASNGQPRYAVRHSKLPKP